MKIGSAGLIGAKLEALARWVLDAADDVREVTTAAETGHLDALLDELRRPTESASIFSGIHFSGWMDQSAARAAMTKHAAGPVQIAPSAPIEPR